METSDTAGRGTSDHCLRVGRGHATCAAKQSTDVEEPHFSAASRIFDLNGEAQAAKPKQNSPIILPI
jgi:hypothetical protein